MANFKLGISKVTLKNFIDVVYQKKTVELSEKAVRVIRKCREFIEKVLREERKIYGVTTGFGSLCSTFIEKDKQRALQKNLILSHASAVGTILPDEVVRGMMFLRAHSLALGFSGVRECLISLMCDFLNKKIYPVIPETGSVGASGDLALLAHMSLPLIGYGKVKYKGKIVETSYALQKENLFPIVLEEKEGLALINGTQFMNASGLLSLHEAIKLLNIANLACAMSCEALLGSIKPFDLKVHALRPHNGQVKCAAHIYQLLENSKIIESHKHCDKVQDAYSLRCSPQVHGAIYNALAHAHDILILEANSVTDNPVVFESQKEVISAGNFHGEPLALPLDYMSIALSELGNISERRIDHLVNPLVSGLPPFLTRTSGVSSGYMIAQYVAAALVSQNKTLAHPASVDSIPTSGNKEDHVSMGANAALKLSKILDNVRKILSIELLLAAQALSFHKFKSSPRIQKAVNIIRKQVPVLKEDRVVSEDIEKIENMLKSGKFDFVVKIKI